MKAKIVLGVLSILLSSPAINALDLPPGQAVLWKQPSKATQDRDLFWGPGSESQKPLPPFTFDGEDLLGTNPKVWVIDQRNIRWGVKFGDEVHSEVAASRFFWAAGYRTDEMYMVPEGTINGVSGLKMAGRHIDSSGRFKNARFKKSSTGEDVAGVEDFFISWGWDDNPFAGTKELSGLLLMNVLTANFDTKTSNNIVQSVKYRSGSVENWYMINDLGGTFGKTERISHSKWNLKDYDKEPFLDTRPSKSLKTLYRGVKAKHFKSIPLEHARWLYELIGSLQRSQIEDAFRSAVSDVRAAPLPNPADEALVQGFADVMERRLRQLGYAVR